MLQFFAGLLLAILVSLAAYRAHSLSRNGAIASTVLGAVVFGVGGLPGSVLLLGFFISSSALSKMFKQRKAGLNEKFAKGSQRDAGQVLANGGIGGLFILLHLAYPQASWPWLGFAGSMAAVNADTWATELGVLSRRLPRLITTGKPVENGTSGGITLEGTLSALVGALFIAALGMLFPEITNGRGLSILAVITLAGLLGSLVDSLLGATIQAIYRCPTCNKETERFPLHTCGSQTQLVRGYRWLDNDWVNTACALVGGVLGLLAVMV